MIEDDEFSPRALELPAWDPLPPDATGLDRVREACRRDRGDLTGAEVARSLAHTREVLRGGPVDNPSFETSTTGWAARQGVEVVADDRVPPGTAYLFPAEHGAPVTWTQRETLNVAGHRAPSSWWHRVRAVLRGDALGERIHEAYMCSLRRRISRLGR